MEVICFYWRNLYENCVLLRCTEQELMVVGFRKTQNATSENKIKVFSSKTMRVV